jgi:lipid-A-disaccharide synthase
MLGRLTDKVPFCAKVMKIFIIAGEASGDLHGGNLVKSLKALHPDTEVRGWGGEQMAAAGAAITKHYRDLAFMGFAEVVMNLQTILNNLKRCKQEIEDFKPDAVVLVDYPGFNLRIAQWLRKSGAANQPKIVYYIAPQVWAWHKSRVHDLRRDVDALLVILPFETEFFKKHQVNAYFTGHPLLDRIEPMSANWDAADTIALLPGSRRQEVDKILPVMLEAIPAFDAQYKWVVAGSTALPASVYERHMTRYPQVKLVQGQTYEILSKAKAALVKSGTSTLETALFGVPQVVCYAGNPLSYWIAKRVVDIKYISLVNLIADAPVVEELIQHDLNAQRVIQGLKDILEPAKATVIRQQYRQIATQLGGVGAAKKAATHILNLIQPVPQ